MSARSTLDDRQVVTVWLGVDQGPFGDKPPPILGSFVHYEGTGAVANRV